MCLCRGHVCGADDGQWGRRLRAGVEPASGLDECVRPLPGVCGCGPWRVQDSASLGGRSTCLLFTCGGKGGERGSGSEKSSGCVLDNCSDVHRLLLPSLFFIQCISRCCVPRFVSASDTVSRSRVPEYLPSTYPTTTLVSFVQGRQRDRSFTYIRSR